MSEPIARHAPRRLPPGLVSLADHEALARERLDLDLNLLRLRQRHGESAETIALSGVYHNLLRQWAST